MQKRSSLGVAVILVLVISCNWKSTAVMDNRLRVIFDTDANNELDDQHALAYLMFNASTFRIEGVTVNATRSGGNIDQHVAEANRVLALTQADGKVPLLKGANGSFAQIRGALKADSFDGSEAVNFIVEQAGKTERGELILLAVGKLTNVALALAKDPSMATRVRVVWLGSNYPKPGEYNLENDTAAMNYVLNSTVPFEMVTVRYGDSTGTAAVTVTQDEIRKNMPGKGPKANVPVPGRHGGLFSTFGDYSANLFEHTTYDDSLRTRALFDMVAVAILKDPSWGQRREVPAPVMTANEWVDRPDQPRKIIIWENFDKAGILEDFYRSMRKYELVE